MWTLKQGAASTLGHLQLQKQTLWLLRIGPYPQICPKSVKAQDSLSLDGLFC